MEKGYQARSDNPTHLINNEKMITMNFGMNERSIKSVDGACVYVRLIWGGGGVDSMG